MSNPEATLERLGCADPEINGAGTISAAAAIYLASRFAARPQDGLLSAAFLRKADTDTLASLTAAILGALHDTHWLGNLATDVQDADYIARLAGRSAARVTDPPPPWPTRRPQALRRALANALLYRRDTHGEFPDGRQYRLEDVAALHDGRVQRARLRLDDGQTVLVDLRADRTAGSSRETHDHREQPSRQPRPAHGQPGNESASATAGDESATTTPLSAPTAAQPSHREASIILATRSLARSAAFYAQVTGRDIPVRGGTAEITPELLLQRSEADTLIDISSVIVHITVDNLPAATRRLGLDTSVADGRTATIEVRDPDGRTVRISQRPASSRPDR